MTINVNGKNYELAYTIGRVSLYESEAGIPLMFSVARSEGLLGVAQLVTLVACGLKTAGGTHLSLDEGLAVAEAHLKDAGYNVLTAEANEALERDCGFLFKVKPAKNSKN